jgi:hypothetical protein
MECISTRLSDGKLCFVAFYLGTGPCGTWHADDQGPLLVEAVKATPGATIAESRNLGVAIHWGDEVDCRYESLFGG